MDKKILAGVIVAVVVVAAVAGAVVMLNNNDDEVTKGVIYMGNGGVDSDGKEKIGITDTTVIGNLFTYDDHTFINWNTKADGTGDSYVKGDTISYGQKTYLYAQWGYSCSFHHSGLVFSDLKMNLVDSKGNSTEIGLNPIGLASDGKEELRIVNGHDWTYDESTKKFTVYIDKGDVQYKYVVEISSDDIDIKSVKVSDSGYPSIIFTYDGPVTMSIYQFHSNV